MAFAEKSMGILKWAIVACIVLSTSGGINSNYFATSRMIYVASREDNFPKFLSMVNVKRRSLVPAMMTICCLAVVMLSMMSLLSTLKIYIILVQASRFIAVCGLFKLRRTHTPSNVIKLPLVIPIFYLFMMASMMVVTIVYTPEVIPKVIIFASTGVLAILLTWIGKHRNSSLRMIYHRIHDPIVKLCRAVLLCEFTDK